MPITFGTKPAAKPSFGASPTAQSSMPSWLKSGGAAHTVFEEQAAAQAAQQAARDKMWRFRLNVNEERRILFLDGDLHPDGRLQLLSYFEHTVQVAGKWQNYVCLEKSDENGDACPLCAASDDPAPVAVFTILDMTPYTIKQGERAGQTIPWQRKLYVAKSTTVKKLDMIARKNGGLRFLTMDVARLGDKEPAVGGQLIPIGKSTPEEIMAGLEAKPEDLLPADYSKELPRFTAQELQKMGIVAAPKGPGYSTPKGFDPAAAADKL